MATHGNDLVREARKRARLTQRELAEKAGTTQSAVARLESGRTRPAFDDVLRLVRLCGFDLDIMLVERDSADWMQAQDCREATAGRASRAVSPVHAPGAGAQGGGGAECLSSSPNGSWRSSPAHGVEFVLIGGLAAATHGSPFLTQDVDITPDVHLDNMDRLSAALRELGARIRTEGVVGGMPFDHDGASLSAAGVWNLTTANGDLDISLRPTGTEGYSDLTRGAKPVTAFGVQVRIASLEDIIRSKQAANRPKDQRVLPTLRELLATRDLDAK